MTQTQARMEELRTKQCLEAPPHTLLSTKTQVGTSTFPVPAYTTIFLRFQLLKDHIVVLYDL